MMKFRVFMADGTKPGRIAGLQVRESVFEIGTIAPAKPEKAASATAERKFAASAVHS